MATFRKKRRAKPGPSKNELKVMRGRQEDAGGRNLGSMLPSVRSLTVTLTFTAQAGLTYTVLYRDAFDAVHPWARLTDLSAQAGTGPVQITDTEATSGTRFSRS